MKLVFLAVVVVPLSVFLWLITLLFHSYNSVSAEVSPVRMLFAVVAPVIIAQYGMRHNSLDKSGAIAGLMIGFCLTVSNFCFFSSLLMFFVAASKATKFRAHEKKKFEDEFKEGGQRNWVQVMCNGGIAAEFAMLYLMDAGCTETLIHFQSHYSSSWFALATLGALCCSCGDTFSSEIGSVVGKGREARLITSFSKVPKGTNGAISFVGTLASFVGGALVGVAFYLTLLLMYDAEELNDAPAQWLVIPAAGLFGLLGSVIDSILGATFQYSGFDKKRQCVVQHPGPGVEYICGSDSLDNHSVNLLSSFITAMLSPRLAFYMWRAITALGGESVL